MKKFTVLVALALIAATGTGYAVTCAQDNVPAATLLIPYFQVGGSAASGTIPAGGVDTTVAITNVSQWGVIAHVTVWNKQSAAVLDFNVPMTGFDVAYFSMRSVLNGNLNVNPNTQKLNKDGVDPCRDTAFIGASKTRFIRFTHPQYANPPQQGTDFFDSIGFYATPAFSGNFRNKILDSLDESPVYTSLAARPDNDVDNPACGDVSDGTFTSNFSGYLTIDVVNYCTNWFPFQNEYYSYEAIATRGWLGNGVAGPNVLIGDVFYIDPAQAGGNISGEAAVGLEFDSRLEFPSTWATTPYKTFYGRYGSPWGGLRDVSNLTNTYVFRGDGREPLNSIYGFRYLSDSANGYQSWATIWRSDVWDPDDATTIPTVVISGVTYDIADVTLCDVEMNGRQVAISTWDNDENQNTTTGGGPSGDTPITIYTNVWWESNRVSLLDNSSMNPAGYKGGWTRFTFQPNNYTLYNQAWVGIEHSAPGLMVSVGHTASVLDNQFTCPLGQGPYGLTAGNVAQ